MKIWGKIAIICLIVVVVTANTKNEVIPLVAATLFWISFIIAIIQKIKNKHKDKNTQVVKQTKSKRKKIRNICWKCQHNYLSDGWWNWFMGLCPKCNSNSTGYYILVVATTVLLVCIVSCQPKDASYKSNAELNSLPIEQKEESKQVQKAEDAPDFVVNGKLVWQIPVCRYSDDFYEYLHAVTNKDYKTTKIYEKQYRCFMLKPGVRVSVLELHLLKPVKIRAYKDGDILDVYTASVYIKGAE